MQKVGRTKLTPLLKLLIVVEYLLLLQKSVADMPSVGTEDVSSVATEDMSSVATEVMSPVATEDLSPVATEDI